MYCQLKVDALDFINTSIYFDEESFKVYTTFESLLLKLSNSRPTLKSKSYVLNCLSFLLFYVTPLRLNVLAPILLIFRNFLFAEREPICELLPACPTYISKSINISNWREKFFNGRRLKTWLRSNMTQKRVTQT